MNSQSRFTGSWFDSLIAVIATLGCYCACDIGHEKLLKSFKKFFRVFLSTPLQSKKNPKESPLKSVFGEDTIINRSLLSRITVTLLRKYRKLSSGTLMTRVWKHLEYWWCPKLLWNIISKSSHSIQKVHTKSKEQLLCSTSAHVLSTKGQAGIHYESSHWFDHYVSWAHDWIICIVQNMLKCSCINMCTRRHCNYWELRFPWPLQLDTVIF